MQAIERRNDALEQRIVNTLTAEVNNPRRNSVGLFIQISNLKTKIDLPGGNIHGRYFLPG